MEGHNCPERIYKTAAKKYHHSGSPPREFTQSPFSTSGGKGGVDRNPRQISVVSRC